MKASDIVKQLVIEIPKHTSLFSSSVAISSLTFAGSTVTAITGAAHGLTTGDYVTIEGALFKNEITSLTSTDDIAYATTSVPHDLTEEWQDTATISGADQSEYNGDKTLLSANTRSTFTYEISGSPASPATGTIYLEENRIDTFNGRYEITVIDPTAFTYETNKDLSTVAGGTPVVYTSARIAPVVDIQAAIDAYTEQNIDKYWAFVVIGEATISRDRAIDNDAAMLITRAESVKMLEIENMSIYVFIPTVDEIAGAHARDAIDDIYPAFLKCIGGYKPPTYLAQTRFSGITPESHAMFAYNKAFYIHEFRWQCVRNISTGDLLPISNTRAFRDADLRFLNDFNEIIMSVNVNIDDGAGEVPFETYMYNLSKLLWTRCDDSSGTTAVDKSGNSNNGAYEGTFTLNEDSLLNDDDNTSVLLGVDGKINYGNIADISGIGTSGYIIKFAEKY